jgi:hypothetical protein
MPARFSNGFLAIRTISLDYCWPLDFFAYNFIKNSSHVTHASGHGCRCYKIACGESENPHCVMGAIQRSQERTLRGGLTQKTAQLKKIDNYFPAVMVKCEQKTKT